MRTIILLRHADTLPPASGQGDFERSLSSRGQQQVGLVLDWLRSQHVTIERVLCSPARRTRETLMPIMQNLALPDVRFERSIYQANERQLAQLLDTHSDARGLLLVGHNPGLEQLLQRACMTDSRTLAGMAPASVALLKAPHQVQFTPNFAQLVDIYTP